MEDEGFSTEYRADWGDLDPNFHVRAGVWLDYATNTQYLWLEHFGITQARYKELGYEPIVLRLEAKYHHEATFGDVIRDTPRLAGLSPDGAQWKVRHSFEKGKGERLGAIIMEGTWLNWTTRQAVAPAPDIVAALNKLARTPNFEVMRSIIRDR
jgi:acyl-CoA thioester hydrolase